MRVIALISGGKDSFLSILQCQKLGHEIIALANLHPPQSQASSNEDLNSHLYQTAGYAVIPLYEQALGIPLYQREISGKASRLEREYDASYLTIDEGMQHDETEDLFCLLQDILKQHSAANAVCSGAILSNYQRTRIEDVCLRLNLKSLAYLWQTSLPLPSVSEDSSISEKAAALLDYFAMVGLDARIVKVASGGLDESYLWQSLLDVRVRHRIKNTMRKFGGSVVGEGGEFETLILSGPRSLFKGEIVVDEDAYHIRKGQGGEAWLDIDVAKIHVRQYDASERSMQMVEVQEIAVSAHDIPGSSENSSSVQQQHLNHQISLSSRSFDPYLIQHGNLLLLGNIHSSIRTETREQEMQLLLKNIRDMLSRENLKPTNLIFTTIILRDMDDFEKVNAVYKTMFTKPLPPSRVTVAAGNQMPSGVSILLSCIACRQIQDKKHGLHVQSISYWAPANIGPYSQAISVPTSAIDHGVRAVFIAGQIPLVSETMLLAKYKDNTKQEEFQKQAILALRHARRIASVMDVSWFSYAVAFVCSDSKAQALERANIAYHIWKNMHEQLHSEEDTASESEGPDIWDIKHGNQRSFAAATDDYQPVPSIKVLRSSKHSAIQTPGFLAVHIDRLPRDASIEWQTVGFSGGTIGVKMTSPYSTSCELFEDGAAVNCCASATVVVVPRASQLDVSSKHDEPVKFGTVYASAENLASVNLVNVSVVPCHRVWGLVDGELVEVSYGFVEQQFSDSV